MSLRRRAGRLKNRARAVALDGASIASAARVGAIPDPTQGGAGPEAGTGCGLSRARAAGLFRQSSGGKIGQPVSNNHVRFEPVLPVKRAGFEHDKLRCSSTSSGLGRLGGGDDVCIGNDVTVGTNPAIGQVSRGSAAIRVAIIFAFGEFTSAWKLPYRNSCSSCPRLLDGQGSWERCRANQLLRGGSYRQALSRQLAINSPPDVVIKQWLSSRAIRRQPSRNVVSGVEVRVAIRTCTAGLERVRPYPSRGR
jgi:hypothetical protein